MADDSPLPALSTKKPRRLTIPGRFHSALTYAVSSSALAIAVCFRFTDINQQQDVQVRALQKFDQSLNNLVARPADKVSMLDTKPAQKLY
jgi:hypothetical protein